MIIQKNDEHLAGCDGLLSLMQVADYGLFWGTRLLYINELVR